MKRYLLTGLIIWAPLAITIWVLQFFIGILDQSMNLLPERYHPSVILGFSVPGAGALLTIMIVMLTGWLVTHILGETLVRFWNGFLNRIPVLGTVYKAVKQVSDTLLTPGGQAFRQAVLVQYPRQGLWTIAFVTGKPGGDAARHLDGDFVSIYVPTTPNPTSGFFLMLAREDIRELNMTVDEALKYIVSMGVVAPPTSLTPKPAITAQSK